MFVLIYGVYVQPMRRFVVDVENALLSALTAHMLAVSSVSITGERHGKSVVSCSDVSGIESC